MKRAERTVNYLLQIPCPCLKNLQQKTAKTLAVSAKSATQNPPTPADTDIVKTNSF